MHGLQDAEPNICHNNPLSISHFHRRHRQEMRDSLSDVYPPRRIPQELVDLIIDVIAYVSLDDLDGQLQRTDTLQACTLVSTPWLPRARKHIFRRVYLRMEPSSVGQPDADQYDPDTEFKRSWLSPQLSNCLSFLRIFCRSPRKPWVEELVVMDLTAKTRVAFLEALSCMERVHRITFGGGSPLDPPYGAQLGSAQFRHVRHLRLQQISIPSLYTLHLLLESMPLLQSFTIVWPTTFNVAYTAVEPSPKRYHFVDIASCPPPFDHHLLSLFTLSNVDKLVVSPALSLDADFRTLRILEIDHTHRHASPSLMSTLPFYDVPKVVLRLTSEAELNDYVQALEDVVTVGALVLMRELQIHVFSNASESPHSQWERLDSILSDIVGLGFERLVVYCPSEGEAIAKAMKSLTKIRMLNVISM